MRLFDRLRAWLRGPEPAEPDPDDMQTSAAEDMTAREIARLTERLRIADDRANAEAMEAVRRGQALMDSEAARFALVEQLAEACRERDDLQKSLNHARGYLRAISARVTASPNAASRDMARIAREALE